MRSIRLPLQLACAVLVAVTIVLLVSDIRSRAASHSDAPLIKQDPQANITDVYAFIGRKYNDPEQRVLNVIVHVRPFSDPGDGVIYERFADDARYSIHIANPTTGETVNRYDFIFSDTNPTTSPLLKNPNTILSYGLGTAAGPITSVNGPEQNYVQVYRVKKDDVTIGDLQFVPPPNVGKNVTPLYNDPVSGKAISGATNPAGLDTYTQQTVYPLPTGEVVFAGPREDGFFADTPAIFDLLDPRIIDNDGDSSDGLGQDGGGVDGFKGFNVLAYALQIPVDSLPEFPYTDPFFGPSTAVGVYASVSRPRVTLRRVLGDSLTSGPMIQVNRMGNPLFNEALVALQDKDVYNRTTPVGDIVRFAKYAHNPELAVLINLVFGTNFVTNGRDDLLAVYIPDVLRVNTTTSPVPLAGQTNFSRLGFIGGDLTDGFSSGWPNGRRLGDDVVDIALTAVASGPSYAAITLVGDNVAANDQVYHQVFPYSATPHAGPNVDQRQSP